jgi:DNA-3-methyladenine glycosylase II
MATATRTRSPRTSRRLQLYPRAPFRLDLTAWALRRREQNALDRWDGRTYRRALLIDGQPVAVAVTQAGTRDAPLLDVVITGRGPFAVHS